METKPSFVFVVFMEVKKLFYFIIIIIFFFFDTSICHGGISIEEEDHFERISLTALSVDLIDLLNWTDLTASIRQIYNIILKIAWR